MSNETPLTVYFESKIHAEIVAKFVDEEIYNLCFPALEAAATKDRMIVTESYDDEETAPSLKSVLDVLMAAGDCIHRHGLLSPTASDQGKRMTNTS